MATSTVKAAAAAVTETTDPQPPLPWEAIGDRAYLVRMTVPADAGDQTVAFVELPEPAAVSAITVTAGSREAAVTGVHVCGTEAVRDRDEDNVPAERHGWLRVLLGVITPPATETEIDVVLTVRG